MRRGTLYGVVATMLAVAASGCSSNHGSAAPGGTPAKPAGAITVLAASSLTKPFAALGAAFEASHPGTTVRFSFGSSSDLERQIEQGVPADVFASADTKNIDKIVAAHDNAGAPVQLAKNKLEIAVEKGNPKHVAVLSDLANANLVVVLCDASVPCGKFAGEALAKAGVAVTPKSRESSVKATLSKVELGEADAAIVYASDVTSSGKVDGVPIPDDVNVVTTLPIVALRSSQHLALAKAWIAFVISHRSELVSKYGFQKL
jgi:molybdate transport system substrate-binding protein